MNSLDEYPARTATWRSVIATWLIAAFTVGCVFAVDFVGEIKSQHLAAHDNKQAEVKSGSLSR